MTTINIVEGIVVGQYGTAIPLRAVDANGAVVNLSSYTGVSVKAQSPDGSKVLTFTGALIGGGSSGDFSFTPTISNTFDRKGHWKGQARFTATDILALTVHFELDVTEII